MFSDDANLAALRAAHQERHGLTIAYIKTRVGPGTEYANEVARAVVSEHGGYYQLAEMPEEFAGALGAGVSHRLVSYAEAWDILRAAQALVAEVVSGTRKVRAVSLYALYAGGSLRTRQKMFVFDHAPGQPPLLHGAWQPDTLPRFFKMRLDCGDLDTADPPLLPGLGLTHGVLFFLPPQHQDDSRALLATLARTPGSQDLGAQTPPTTRN